MQLASRQGQSLQLGAAARRPCPRARLRSQPIAASFAADVAVKAATVFLGSLPVIFISPMLWRVVSKVARAQQRQNDELLSRVAQLEQKMAQIKTDIQTAEDSTAQRSGAAGEKTTQAEAE